MARWRVLREAAPRPVAALAVAVVLVGIAFSLSTVPGVRPRPTFWVPVDGWLQGTGYVLLAALVVARPVLVREHRGIWSLVAAAVTARAIGYVLFFGVVRLQRPQPYPSLSDPFWVLASLLLLVALAERARRHGRHLPRLLALDGAVAALTVAALGLVLLRPTLLALTAPGVPERALVVNLVYPVLDVMALVAIAGLFATGFRPRRSEILVMAGIGVFAVVESVYLYEVAAGTFRPGTYLSALSYLGTALLALGAWVANGPQPTRVRPVRPELAPRPTLLVPVSLAVICLLTLIVAPYTSAGAGPLAVAMLVGSVLVMIVRGVLTVTVDRSEAERVIASRTEEAMRFQALVEASKDFIALARLDGQVFYVNPAGRDLVGLAPDFDVTTASIVEFLTEQGIEDSLTIEQPAVKEFGHWEGESTLRDRRGGPPIPVAIASFLVRDLETGEPFALATVQRDVTERHEAEQALRELADQRRDLLERLVEAQEDERHRIAADVHDDSVQALAAVELRLGLLRRQLGAADPSLQEAVGKAHRSVTEATARLRHLLFDLESPALRADLATALTEAADFVLEDTGVRWSLLGDRAIDLPQAVRVTAYRVAKEALTNVRKHAGARQVEIRLTRVAGGVEVVVADDGHGVGAGALVDRPGHLGVSGMRDRASVAGGRVEVGPGPQGGTTVRLWLPDGPPASVEEHPDATPREDTPP
ncbi:MAG: domain S-box protein [Marmoricola sp.]|nr:domain S-box protein [Marmoricola sp.]